MRRLTCRIGSSGLRASEQGLIKLETAVKFDKLGVQEAILQIEVLRDQKRALLRQEQFLPMLDRVAEETKASCVCGAGNGSGISGEH